ncbi:GNAT family N-acetyltransferase [Phyllobacterium myrsinacearum]|uniref:Putative N-acetyltransferase YhbS n=1 Tax=Phyllobacterium myrsinacearum TaxID=28101 RepID=A0A839EFA3_9HYPH|nr:GNAT family N-acetyltransferase [Phyllobacterium myrsinacearum]MBA8877602.1 putative N-acetyltransferase YhbS [Phyllobacterium myrsinacearum]
MITVEPLENRPELVPVCARWNFHEWGQQAGRTMQETVDAFMAFLEPDSRQKAFVALHAGIPSGLVLLIDNDLESHTHLVPWLASLYVAPPFRSKGIGKQLISAAENAARELGHPELYLYTDKPDYYHAVGWQDREELSGENAGMTILNRSL